MPVTVDIRYVCYVMNIFFDIFINYFPKIHRSALRKITIDLLYFRDVCDGNLWGKSSSKSTVIHAEQMFLYNFIVLIKKETPTQVFSFGICETFKNSGTCFWKHLTYVIKKIYKA